MNKPILFVDFDGTLCHDRFWRSLPTDAYEKLQVLLFGADRSMVEGWMLGEYTSEEVNEFASKELGIPYEELWNIFVKDCETMHVSSNTLEKISSLKKRFTTILITDNMDCFERFTVSALGLNNYFDKIVSSHNEKRHKRDDNGASFTKYLNEYGADIKDSYLIDDSKGTCDLFTSLGGTGYLITPENNIDFYLEKI